MITHSDIAVNGNRVTSITINEVECYVLGNQSLGSLINSNTETSYIMYDDSSIFWKGLTKIRIDPPTKQWSYCKNNIHVVRCNCKNGYCNHNKEGCKCAIKTPIAKKHRNKVGCHFDGNIPYPTKKPSNSIREQIMQVQPMNRDMNKMPLEQRSDEIGRILSSHSFLINQVNSSKRLTVNPGGDSNG
jgi:hypothetical protein